MKNIQNDSTDFQIRRVDTADVEKIVQRFIFPWSTHEKTQKIWDTYLHEHKEGKGYGTKLLDAAEQETVKNGCVFSAVDSFDFQAEEFYLKKGYERIGELKNCWLGHSKLFLRKNLKHSNKKT